MEYVLAITGGSGIAYGFNILENLPSRKVLILSNGALEVAKYEMRGSLSIESIRKEVDEFHMEDDMTAPQASGSHKFEALIIAPASMNTVAKIASGISDNLVTRVASVALKERRKFILLFREMPLSSIQLQNLLKLSESGAIVMPASPGFYHSPRNINDMLAFVTSRVLDELGLENSMIRRWGDK